MRRGAVSIVELRVLYPTQSSWWLMERAVGALGHGLMMLDSGEMENLGKMVVKFSRRSSIGGKAEGHGRVGGGERIYPQAHTLFPTISSLFLLSLFLICFFQFQGSQFFKFLLISLN